MELDRPRSQRWGGPRRGGGRIAAAIRTAQSVVPRQRAEIAHCARNSRHTRSRRNRDSSRSAAKRDDRQMLSIAEIAHGEFEIAAMRQSPAWHSRPSLESSPRRRPLVERFLWSTPKQVHVRSGAVVPGSVGFEFPAHGTVRVRDEGQPTRALLLHRTDEALDDADTRRLAEVAVTRPNPSSLAPALERLAPELAAAIGDDVARRGATSNASSGP